MPRRELLVPVLIFRSIIHFEFIFVYGIRKCSDFIILHVAVQFSQPHLLKGLFFLHCVFLPLCHKLVDCRCLLLIVNSLNQVLSLLNTIRYHLYLKSNIWHRTCLQKINKLVDLKNRLVVAKREGEGVGWTGSLGL